MVLGLLQRNTTLRIDFLKKVVKKCATTKNAISLLESPASFKRVCLPKCSIQQHSKKCSILINQNLVVLVIYLENMQFMAFHTQLPDLI